MGKLRKRRAMIDEGIPAGRKPSSQLQKYDGAGDFAPLREFSGDESVLDNMGEPRASAACLAD
jgi:hypothetical protein